MARGQKGGKHIETIQGYEILKSVTFENGRGFALAFKSDTPEHNVIWHFSVMANGEQNYYDLQTCNGIIPPEQEFDRVISAYKYVYHVPEKAEGQAPQADYFRYYSTQRPVDIGTFPKSPDCLPLEIANYDKRRMVEGGAMQAWGEIIYKKPLTEKQMADYELKPFPDNADRAARPSITAQLKEAARRPEPPKEPDKTKHNKSHEDR